MEEYCPVPFHNIRITDGFWRRRQDVNRGVTLKAVFDRFSETHRFDALNCKRSAEYEPHIFWDSDVAKWIEGAAYLLAEERDDELERLCDGLIDKIVSNQAEDGYFNSYYLAVGPECRFTKRENHELYCAGHLIEAAVAYRNATGKDAFLRSMCRYADLIYDVFYVKNSATFMTPGHEEIELALFRLADATGEEKYAKLALRFLDARGNNVKDANHLYLDGSYDQSHKPLKKQTEAVGHAVRAGYVYSAMADAARRFGDGEYAAACEKLFDNIVNCKMYVTGGIGSTGSGEAFTSDYDLPNKTAYAETCAAIALAYFARRMLLLKPDSRYADTIERVMYNGALSGVSLDGEKFFYSNPLETSLPGAGRAKVFDCSCCPPNILRFIASITEDFYTYSGDVLFVHQFAASEANVCGASVKQETSYPANGEIKLAVKGGFKKAALRIPGWCSSFTLSEPYELIDGYAYAVIPESREITLTLDMPARLVRSHPAVTENEGKAAVMRGPIVYCMEGKDNGSLDDILLCKDGKFEEEYSETLGVPLLKTTGSRGGSPAPLTLIPYFAQANRGADEMKVWIKTT